jgi:hypothetical protein
MKECIVGYLVATVLISGTAYAGTYVVPGTADPWLANGGMDTYAGDPANTDTVPAYSPVTAGSVIGGSLISWTATGATLNMPGTPTGDPNGGVLTAYVATLSGESFPIPAETFPINSLVGVFTGPGFALPFEMGASGSYVVPAGATELYLGSMDGYQWNNNVGSFNVTVNGVPDGGSTFAMFGLAILGCAGWCRKQVRAC